MKNIYLALLIILIVSSCKPRYYSLSETDRSKFDIKPYSAKEKDLGKEQFYSITSNDIPLLKNNKENNLIVFFAAWCVPCREKMPALLSSIRDKDINLSLISADDFVRKPMYEKYINDLKYKGNIYFLDIKTYKSWNPHKNMRLFMEEAFPKVDNVKGYPTGILMKKDSVLYSGVIDSAFVKNFLK